MSPFQRAVRSRLDVSVLLSLLAACGQSMSGPDASTDALGADGHADHTSPNDSTNDSRMDAPGDAPPNDAPPPSDGTSTCGHASILDGFTPLRTLYVSTTGSDAADGLTSATAWATLAHGSAFEPGDEIRIAPGTYPCPSYATITGTAAAPIHFVASGGPRSAVLDCTMGASIFMTNIQYVAFDGFEIRNAQPGNHCINLNSGGAPYTNLSEHVLFVNDYIHACSLSALKVSQAFEIEVRNSELSDNVTTGNPLIDFVAVHDSRVLGSYVHDSVSDGIQMKGGAYDCLIAQDHVENAMGDGINMGEATGGAFFLPGYSSWEASQSIVANNLLTGTFAEGAIAAWGCDQCTIAHNTVWATNAHEFVRGLPSMDSMGNTITDTGLIVEDNIFAAMVVPIPLNIPPPNDMGLVQGYNLYFSTGGLVGPGYSDTPIGGAGNLVDVDPMFVSSTTPDLHLATGSPAIGAATPIASVMGNYAGGCNANDNLGAW